MRTLVKDSTFKGRFLNCPLFQKTAFSNTPVFEFCIVRKQEIVRTIHIEFKRALMLTAQNEIVVCYVAAYIKENYKEVLNPFKCTIAELINTLSDWVVDTDLIALFKHPYKLTKKEAEWILLNIIYTSFPEISNDLSYARDISRTSGELTFIKYYE